MYTNADCFSNKTIDLIDLLNSLNSKPSIIAITEVNSKLSLGKKQESEYNLDGYNIFSVNVGASSFRGIIVYVENSIQANQIEIPSDFKECLFIQLGLKNGESMLLGTFYRSPSSNYLNDKELIELVSDSCKTTFTKKLFIGDFNLANICWSNWTTNCTCDSLEYKFLSCLRNNLLIQNVDTVTRARGLAAPHILDLVISNDSFVNDINYLSPLGKSDHAVLYFSCNMLCTHSHYVNKYNYNKGDYDGLRNFMNRNWQQELSYHVGDVNSAWSAFKLILNEGINKYIPYTTGNNWKRKNSWQRPISSNMKTSIKKKHKLWHQFQKTKNQETWIEFKRVRNAVRKDSRIAIQKENVAVAKSCKENPKKFWKHVKSKSVTYSTIGNIKHIDSSGNTVSINDDAEKAEVFAEYFSKVFTYEPPDAFEKLNNFLLANAMEEIDVTEEIVYKKLFKLKVDKSPGPDMIHPRILKETSVQITRALQLLFEMSLSTCALPDDWTSSIISVIHKKGSRDSASNYRPISLTCISCKILESIIRDHLMNHFTSNNLFSKKQFGFISGRSTVLQLLNVVDKWTQDLETGGQIDIVYTDFEKAFDKVPHQRLLSKLVSYGVHCNLIKWIEMFLCFRSYQVRINGKFSQCKAVASGIPQGSVLGPLLFVIYINDLDQFCGNNGELFLFADDAKLFKHIQSMHDSYVLNTLCQNLFSWSEKWLMKLNIDKCKVLTITLNKNLLDYKYSIDTMNSGTVVLERVYCMKDLGVNIDSDLNFKDHIYEKIKKAYQMLGIINRNFSNLDRFSFLLLYKSMVRSHIEYANVVWSPYKDYLIKDLERVQKRATKMVKGLRNLSYKERLINLQLPTLKFRRIRGDMIEVFKILSGVYDMHVCPTLLRSENVRTRGNCLKLQTNRTRYDIRKYSFSNRIVKIWNSLPDVVISADSVNCFKNKLDVHWRNEEIYFNYEVDLSI